MSTPVAIVVGFVSAAAILALALLIAFRWEIAVRPEGLPFRLDRWTGIVVGCNSPPSEAQTQAMKDNRAIPLRCEP